MFLNCSSLYHFSGFSFGSTAFWYNSLKFVKLLNYNFFLEINN